MTPETDGKTASLSEKVKVFMTKIVTAEATQAGRQDVLTGIPPGHIEAARRTYARAMSDTETPLAIFLDFKHHKATRGMLITDRFVYSAHMPAALPVDRIGSVELDGGGFTPQKLRINGVAFLVHRTIDSLAVDILSKISHEVRERKLQGKLVQDDASRRAALSNETHVRAAAEGVASGSATADIQQQLQGRGMDSESADILARGLLALSEPGNVASGAALVLVGVLCLGLIVLLLVDPTIDLVFNPVFMILGAIGAIVVAGVGVQSIRSVKKRRKDTEGMVRTWLGFLTPSQAG